jgi:hypothetical protein
MIIFETKKEKQMEKTERNEAIFEDRNNKMTYKEIGEKYSITPVSARYIFCRLERQKKYKARAVKDVTEEPITSDSKAVDFMTKCYSLNLISCRVFNSIKNLTRHYPDMTVWQLANYSKWDYLKLQNFRKVCLNELYAALETIMGKGYVPETIDPVKINKTKVKMRKFLGEAAGCGYVSIPAHAKIYAEWEEPKTTKKVSLK